MRFSIVLKKIKNISSIIYLKNQKKPDEQMQLDSINKEVAKEPKKGRRRKKNEVANNVDENNKPDEQMQLDSINKEVAKEPKKGRRRKKNEVANNVDENNKLLTPEELCDFLGQTKGNIPKDRVQEPESFMHESIDIVNILTLIMKLADLFHIPRSKCPSCSSTVKVQKLRPCEHKLCYQCIQGLYKRECPFCQVFIASYTGNEEITGKENWTQQEIRIFEQE
ncbi:hypothetical protein TKK_0002498 [Trichogramma kaykai]